MKKNKQKNFWKELRDIESLKKTIITITVIFSCIYFAIAIYNLEDDINKAAIFIASMLILLLICSIMCKHLDRKKHKLFFNKLKYCDNELKKVLGLKDIEVEGKND